MGLPSLPPFPFFPWKTGQLGVVQEAVQTPGSLTDKKKWRSLVDPYEQDSFLPAPVAASPFCCVGMAKHCAAPSLAEYETPIFIRFLFYYSLCSCCGLRG
ncbi:hypothetical protein Taro_037117 [Colocasia esculenta]|uniref:Uncharacterized protein n=1 Tax=Colocasia esculenta TaxID=4460 RepID=A0A843WIA1_COLES|nr:hypothetical protein [Colocasia esculenta]